MFVRTYRPSLVHSQHQRSRLHDIKSSSCQGRRQGLVGLKSPEVLEGVPQNWGLRARAAVQRANLSLAVTAKLPEWAKMPFLLDIPMLRTFQLQGALSPDPLTRGSAPRSCYRLALRARHVSFPKYGALVGFSSWKAISPQALACRLLTSHIIQSADMPVILIVLLQWTRLKNCFKTLQIVKFMDLNGLNLRHSTPK